MSEQIELIHDVEINYQRGTGPVIGDTVEGHIQQSNFGPKLKREKSNFGGTPFTVEGISDDPPNQWEGHGKKWDSYKCDLVPGQGANPPKPATTSAQSRSNGAQGNAREDYWQRKELRDTAAEPRMARAHAQEMALRREHNLIASGEKAFDSKRLKQQIEYFYGDAQQAQPFGGSGGGADGAPATGASERPTAPSEGIPDEKQEEIKKAYRLYLAAAPDGPNAKAKVQAFLNANEMESMETLNGGQADLLLDFLTNSALDDEVPF